MGTVLAILLFLLAADPVDVPPDPGLYYLNPGGLARIEGRTVSLDRKGSRLTSSATLGIKGDRKVNAQILGEHAEQKVVSAPVFYYRAPAAKETLGGVGDLVLVKLKTRKRRREFEISREEDWKSSAGISLKSQVEFYKKQVDSAVYKLVPAESLEPGEYGFYLFRGYDLPGLIYDFSVE